MDTLRFVIDQNTIKQTLTGEDIETVELFQEGEQVGTYRLKKMAAKFMVDDAGAPVPYKQAIKIFNQMNAEEYSEGLMQFVQAMVDVALPKGSGMPLNSHSEVTSPKQAASPDGS
jgi:hypothetical protein